MSADSGAGVEWVIEARGCDPARLGDVNVLAELFTDIVDELSLHVVGAPSWHVFPGAGGVTGVCMLAESHIAVHTFPEHASLCLNVFCCRPRANWDVAKKLTEHVGAADVEVRRVERRYSSSRIALAT